MKKPGVSFLFVLEGEKGWPASFVSEINGEMLEIQAFFVSLGSFKLRRAVRCISFLYYLRMLFLHDAVCFVMHALYLSRLGSKLEEEQEKERNTILPVSFTQAIKQYHVWKKK